MEYKLVNINYYDNKKIETFYKKIYLEKKIKINAFVNLHRKKVAIIGEIILSELLYKIYKINYQSVEFLINKNGKPYIKNYNIYFNISHSNDYVIVCLSANEIGIDIEFKKPVNLKVIKYFANIEEKKYILNDDTFNRIFEIFTLKEAYLKMMGLTLFNINSTFCDKLNKNLTINKLFNYNFILNNSNCIIVYCERI